MKLSFEYLRDQLVKHKAKSEYKQVAIVMLRSIFKSAEEDRRKKKCAKK